MGIIVKPLVTEKMTAITEKFNRFGFIVRPEANKVEIKKEVEALYNGSCSYQHISWCSLQQQLRYTTLQLLS